MKDARPSGGHELQKSPDLRYVLAIVSAFTALTGALALVRETLVARNYAFFVIELLVIMVVACLCIWLSMPRFWQKKRLKPEPLNLKSDGKHFYGYKPQVELFRRVLSAAKAEISDKGAGSPLIAVFGKSGVGKSSFLMHCFPNRERVIHLDLRMGLTLLIETLEATFGPSPPGTSATPRSIQEWLQDRVASPLVRQRLSETVLIIDQFEQVIANKRTLEIAMRLFRTLAPHCLMVIVCVRSDVLGDAVDGIRKLLPDPVDVSRKLRLFELHPIQSAEEKEELLCGVWRNIMTDSPDPNIPLLTHLGEMLYREERDRAMLPVFVKLAVYALKTEKIQSVEVLKAKTGDKVGNLLDGLLRKECASTENEELASRILFSLFNDTGVAEEFNAAKLSVICSTGAGSNEVKNILEQLETIGIVRGDVSSGSYTLCHEYLGELARKRARKSMTPSEMEQIRARQSLVKNSDSSSSYEHLCDVKERVRILSYEGIFFLLGLLIGISRLFFWSPQGVHVEIDRDFVPAALGWLGTSFFFWMLYGNVGKATIPYQNVAGRTLWKLTSLGPLVGWAICCFLPDIWLVVGSGVTIVVATTYLQVSRWAKEQESEDVAAIFKGFSTTTFSFVLIFLFTYGMLWLIRDSSWYRSAGVIAGTISLVWLVRSGVYQWHGRMLRDLLARIDLGIFLRRAEKPWSARG